MTGLCLTATIISITKELVFLFFIGVFSYYLVFTGYRSLYHKSPAQSATTLDWIGCGLACIAGVALLLYGAMHYLQGDTFGLIAILFGGVCLKLAIEDMRFYRRPPTEPQAWLYKHLDRMIGAYIATWTAFSAVNFDFLPQLVRWTWPTVLGGTAIVLFTRHYKKQFKAHTAKLETKL